MTAERLLRDLADTPPGPALAALLDTIDPGVVGPDAAVALLRAWSRQRAHTHARMCAVTARVAALSRAASAGSALGERAGSEIAAALTWSETKAARELDFAEALTTLPAVAAAFDAGRIDHGKAWTFVDVLIAAELTDAQCEAVCAALLPGAPGWTAGQLRHRLVRAVLAVDHAWAARRYERAVRERGVRGYLAPDGTATITATGLSADEAAAACARVDLLAARIRAGGHPGTLAQIRAEVFLRLLDGSLTGMNTEQIIAALAKAHRGEDTGPGPVADSGDDPGAAEPARPASPPTRRESAAAASASTETTPTATASAETAADTAAAYPAAERTAADTTRADTGTTGTATTGTATTPRGSGCETGQRTGGAAEAAAPGPVGEPTSTAACASAGPGVEIRVGLATLLGRDQRPGDLPGWGPVLPDAARAIVARQRRAQWRFAVVDDDGQLLLAGLTRRRPRLPFADQQAPGGIVELQVSAAELAALSADPATHPAWAGTVADLAEQFARRDELRAALDAHPGARLVRGALLRHVQVRDRTCIAPGCRRSASRTDADHTIAVATGGATVAVNTGPLCGWHHALKHDGGWRLEQPEAGLFRWTSPLRQRYQVRGEPVMPPLPEPLPRPLGDEPPEPRLIDLDIPTFDPGRPTAPDLRAPPLPRPISWRAAREDADDPAPF